MKQLNFNEITNKILDKCDVLAIIIYGSFSRNTQTNDSDIDIAIIDKNITKNELFELKKDLEILTYRDVDLVNLEDIDISESLRYEILMNGNLLYCKDEFEYEMYKIEKLKEFLDFNESRKDIIDRIKNGGTIYGE